MSTEDVGVPSWEGGEDWPDLAAADAFGALGNTDRIAILRALWDRSHHWQLSVDSSAGFVELQEAAGFDDNGRFNYHLKQLVGAFVRQTSAGYELTHAGKSIVRLIQSGNLGSKPAYGPTVVEEGRCPYCGGAVALYYRDDHVLVLCDRCAQASEELGTRIPAGIVGVHSFSPSAFRGRSVPEIYELVGKRTVTTMDALASGHCPECSGTVTTDLDPSDSNPGRKLGFGYFALSACDVCSFVSPVALWIVALRHPELIAFYADHDIDVATPSWRLFERFEDKHEEIGAREPASVRVRFRYADESQVIHVDDTLTPRVA